MGEKLAKMVDNSGMPSIAKSNFLLLFNKKSCAQYADCVAMRAEGIRQKQNRRAILIVLHRTKHGLGGRVGWSLRQGLEKGDWQLRQRREFFSTTVVDDDEVFDSAAALHHGHVLKMQTVEKRYQRLYRAVVFQVRDQQLQVGAGVRGITSQRVREVESQLQMLFFDRTKFAIPGMLTEQNANGASWKGS